MICNRGYCSVNRILCIILLAIAMGFGAWESIGPYGGQLRVFDVARTNEDIILVASNQRPGRLFKSTDNGSTWHSFGSLEYYVSTILFDPTNENTIYLGTLYYIYKSTDGGETWTPDSVCESYINDLVIHSNAPATLHIAASVPYGASVGMGYYRSTNGGITWTSMVLDTLKGVSTCAAISHSDADIVCIGGNSSYNNQNLPRVYRSTDGGASFIDVSSNLPIDYGISSIGIHPVDSDIMYVTSFFPGDIYRTTNAGISWSLVQTAPFVTSVAVSPITPDHAYAGADTVIYKTTDAGATWFNCGSGYSSIVKQPRHILASANTASNVYCIDFKGFSRSGTSGATWQDCNYGITLAKVITLECAPSLSTTVYAALDMTGVIKTTNSGTSWTLLPEFLSCGNICSFAVHNTDPDIVLALEGSG